MKKVYIALSFSERKKIDNEIYLIKNILKKKNYEPVVFVNDFSFSPDSSDSEMMDTALSEINDSEIIIAELSHKAIGVGLEVGYAKALGKKVFYLYKEGLEYSKTVGGISDEIISYSSTNQLKMELEKIL